MDLLYNQIAPIGALLFAVLGGPYLAMFMLNVRRRRARAERRSPLGIELLRSPGHSLREAIDELRLDIMGDVLLLAVLPSLLIGVHLAQSHWLGARESVIRSVGISALVFGLLAFALIRLHTRSSRMDALRLGFDAEVAVGQQLDQLMRRGAFVFHDFPAEHFNIDHVVIATQGVFAVETKGYSKRNQLPGKERAKVEFDGRSLRFPGWTTSEPLEQAERQAKWLSEWLSSATGTRIDVLPVLALPGWFIDRKAEGSVEVFSGKELEYLFDRRRLPSTMSVANVTRAAHQVEQRCRNVTPSYTRVDAPRAQAA